MMDVKDYLLRNGIYDLPQDERFVRVVHLISEIPWGECRSVSEVLEKGKGTCTGKHLLLQECLEQIGVSYKPVVCTFRWQDQPVEYPEKLRHILQEGSWDHGHNFVTVDYLGNSIDVDITWNSKLAKYGFTCLPSDWNGKTSFFGVVHMQKRWDDADIRTMKKELIESLSPEQRERRERFLHNFIEWVEEINS
jgi:hypothetical protein